MTLARLWLLWVFSAACQQRPVSAFSSAAGHGAPGFVASPNAIHNNAPRPILRSKHRLFPIEINHRHHHPGSHMRHDIPANSRLCQRLRMSSAASDGSSSSSSQQEWTAALCYTLDPRQRPSARQIVRMLEQALDGILEDAAPS